MTREEIIQPQNFVYGKSPLVNDTPMHYCPGCSHGVVHKLIAEVIEEMNLAEKTIGVCPVGCAVFAYNYFNCDMIEAAHGRAPAVATGVKRALPDRKLHTDVHLLLQRHANVCGRTVWYLPTRATATWLA